ncbi:MAG: eL32 family ribosomal protein [Candidatus Micrarchaeales archaeon]|jgi:ribosomal protein L32E
MLNRKSHPKFRVPNYRAKSRKGVKERWRAQRGIDNKKRVAKSGYGASPCIGYKNPPNIRFTRSDGTREILVHNEREMFNMPKDEMYIAIFAHDLSVKKRALLQKIADANRIKVANRLKK